MTPAPAPQHLEWDGLVLPVDHPFWQTHGPAQRIGLATFRSDSVSRPGPYAEPPAQSQARVPRGLPTPTNSHVVQPRLTKSREFSGRPTRGNSRIEGTRPVRSGLPPPPSSPANLDREETRAGFLPSFRGFAGVGCNTRRPGGAERAALSLPVSSLDFRGERLRRRLPSGCSVYATVATLWPFAKRSTARQRRSCRRDGRRARQDVHRCQVRELRHPG